MSTNPLVSFLRHYGPIPASENMYDELIQTELVRHKIDPAIEIPPHRLHDLLTNFQSDTPTNVILTGTAGDGKTYHCRSVWEELGGDQDEWKKGRKINSLLLPNSGRKLIFVKDLSELRPDEKDQLYPDLAKSIHDKQSMEIFLIAANDGQLIASLREWAKTEGEEARSDFVEIQRMLVDNDEVSTTLFLSLYNLSRSDVASVFDDLLEQIVEHGHWEKCTGCPIHDETDPKCPIRINRGLLRRDSDSLLRQRLKDLLRLSAANRMHLPIRHLLLLAVNAILGDQKSGRSLLSCVTAKNRAEATEYNLTSPFANVFGQNLLERQRTQYQAFNVLAHFGVGMETDNAFDNLLIYGPFTEDDRYQELVGRDSWYGDSSNYRRLVGNYVEGEREFRSAFLSALANQRRRLFFSLADGAYDDLDPWRLTVYRHSGQFLEFCQSLANGDDVARILTPLIRGLNRTFCGLMIDTGDQGYLGTSGGDGRGRLANLMSFAPLPTRRSPRSHYIRFALSRDEVTPVLEIVDPTMGDTENAVVETIELQLIHFEYLMRVSTGSLPASFSRQCYEDFLDLKLRLVEKLGNELKEFEAEASDTLEFTALTLDDSGRPDHQTYTIRFESQS